jgi:hypothetical protein
MENIRVRLAPGIYGRILRAVSNANSTGGIKPSDNAAFGAQPQGYGVANRLAAEAGLLPISARWRGFGSEVLTPLRTGSVTRTSEPKPDQNYGFSMSF